MVEWDELAKENYGAMQKELAHHGILGQKWGVRRYQNKDGSLTSAGKSRYQNEDGSINDSGEKHIRKNIWNKQLMGENSNRNKLGSKINSELQSTKEAKDYNDLMNKRGIVIKDSKGNVIDRKLSYLNDDWSDPEKVYDQMIKDMKIEEAYHAKDVEITNKYPREFAGATLKDLGFDDPDKFWKMTNSFASKYNMDPTLSFMYVFLDVAKKQGKKITEEYLESMGKNIKFFPGLENGEFFDKITEFASSHNVNLLHYVISSGNREIIKGTNIFNKFSNVS